MKKSQFTDQHIAFAVQQPEAGVAAEELCRKLEISQSTYSHFPSVHSYAD